MKTTSILVLAGLLAACGGEKPAAPPPPPTVSGHMILQHWDSAGHVQSDPFDLHEMFFETYEQDGKGGWDVHAGAGYLDGTFSVPDAHPHGPYWLRLFNGWNGAEYYVYTDATDLDFDQDVAGRLNLSTVEAKGTRLEVIASDLQPWSDGDSLIALSENLGRPFPLSGGLSGMGGDPNLGDTTFDQNIDWSGIGMDSLISHREGDDVLVVQNSLKTEPVTGTMYYAAVAGGLLDPIELTDGFTTVTHGQLTPAPALDYHLNWKRSEFSALLPQTHPLAAESGGSFKLAALPGGQHRANLFWMDPYSPYTALAVDPVFFETPGDLDATFTIGNPYPQGWLVNQFGVVFSTTYVSPYDSGVSAEMGNNVAVVTTDLPTADTPVRPLISQAQSPTIAGKSLFEEQNGVGTTPVVAWTAPQIGKATSYVIALFEWSPDGLKELAELYIPGDVTSVQMPPDLLKRGSSYFVQIEAVSQAGQDARHNAGFRNGYPLGIADLSSSLFTP